MICHVSLKTKLIICSHFAYVHHIFASLIMNKVKALSLCDNVDKYEKYFDIKTYDEIIKR